MTVEEQQSALDRIEAHKGVNLYKAFSRLCFVHSGSYRQKQAKNKRLGFNPTVYFLLHLVDVNCISCD